MVEKVLYTPLLCNVAKAVVKVVFCNASKDVIRASNVKRCKMIPSKLLGMGRIHENKTVAFGTRI